MRRGSAVLPGLVGAVVLALVLGLAWATTRGGDGRDPVTAALAAAPDGSVAVGVTVWSRLPDSVGAAARQDLTSRSVAVGFDDELRRLGWGVTDLEWEAAIGTPDGLATVLGLGDLDPADVAQGFPVTTGSGGFLQSFAHVEVLRTEGILVAAANQDAVRSVVDTIRGRRASLLRNRGVAEAAELLTGRASVRLQDARTLCELPTELSADEVDALRQVEVRHGPLEHPTWTVRALGADPRRYVFATVFDSPDRARRQLVIREALASGRFIGRIGSVEQSLTDRTTRVDGAVVSLEFRPTGQAEPYMVEAGPVVFNGCAVPSQ